MRSLSPLQLAVKEFKHRQPLHDGVHLRAIPWEEKQEQDLKELAAKYRIDAMDLYLEIHRAYPRLN